MKTHLIEKRLPYNIKKTTKHFCFKSTLKESMYHWIDQLKFFFTKLAEMPILASKDLTATKKLPAVGLNLIISGSRDYWFKSPMLNQLS